MNFFCFPIKKEFDRLGDLVLEDFRLQIEKGLPFLDQVGEMMGSKRSPGRKERNGFQKVCFALRIVAKNDVCLWTEANCRFFIVAKVAQVYIF